MIKKKNSIEEDHRNRNWRSIIEKIDGEEVKGLFLKAVDKITDTGALKVGETAIVIKEAVGEEALETPEISIVTKEEEAEEEETEEEQG